MQESNWLLTVPAESSTSPHRDNIIVVLWGDNGFHLGDKETWEKFTLWEESTRIPLVIAAPGVARPGSLCAAPARLLDPYPTLVELTGLKRNPKNETISVVAQLRDPKTPRKQPAICTNGQSNHAVRSDRYQHIRYGNGDEELYDPSNDEEEWNNLATDLNYADIMTAKGNNVPSDR